ncbi:hypothetical protein EGW08_000706 [Elysia chlorotica]|uniref:Major facilitator superfamily associated domain-containing protein n=1 Tax=Elysia chlorotica TaxID=188477 RepID=A0A433UCL2_ELYCH|nr:hypothetical protein EGW08_000706 [Elysia chlorotica]
MRTLPKAHRKIYENNTLSFFVLFYLQGIPYSLQTRFLPLLLTEKGTALFYIALYKLAILPWAMKIIWAPVSIITGQQKRKYLNASLAGLILVCLAISRYPPWNTFCFSLVLVMFNVVASLSDVALNTLVDEVSEKRRASYTDRLQFVGNCAGALTVGIAACLTDFIKWQELFSGLAVLYFIGLLTSTCILPQWKTPRARDISLSKNTKRGSRRSVSQDLDSSLDNGLDSYYTIKFTTSYMNKLLKTEGSWWLILMLLGYKVGEQGLMNNFPLYLLRKHYNISDVGFWTAFFSQAMSVSGSIFGFYFKSRTLKRAVMVHFIARALFSCFLWFSVMKWDVFPDNSYVMSIASFSALFFISASMTSCVLQMIARVSHGAPRKIRKDLFDLLLTADVFGKVFLTTLLGGCMHFYGVFFEDMFGVYVTFSIVLIPMFYVVSKRICAQG